MPLAELFARLEVMRSKFNLVDQSVSQTTLEQVFLGFAAKQHVDEPASRKISVVSAASSARPSLEPPSMDNINIIRTSAL